MTRPIRIGVLLQPDNAPDFTSWRSAVLHAEELGADLIFSYDHFHKPAYADLNEGMPVADVRAVLIASSPHERDTLIAAHIDHLETELAKLDRH